MTPKEHLLQTFANAATNYYEETGVRVFGVEILWTHVDGKREQEVEADNIILRLTQAEHHEK